MSPSTATAADGLFGYDVDVATVGADNKVWVFSGAPKDRVSSNGLSRVEGSLSACEVRLDSGYSRCEIRVADVSDAPKGDNFDDQGGHSPIHK